MNVVLPAVVAQAGGGGGGFGGGGGGGGGGAGGGAGGGEGGGSVTGGDVVAFVVAAAILAALFVLLPLVWRAARRRRRDLRIARRERLARSVAREAAGTTPAFAPEDATRSALDLFQEIQGAWDRDDRARLRDLVAPELYAEWRRRLDDFEAEGSRSRAVVPGPVTAWLIGVHHVGDLATDRLVFLVRSRMKAWVELAEGTEVYRTGSSGPDIALEQYWTLRRRLGDWVLGSIEERGEGEHNLEESLVATAADDEAARDRVRTDLATDDAIVDPGPLATVDADARAVVLDLALVDDRFSPDVLEAAVRGVVRAWTTAVDGPRRDLEDRCDPRASAVLLFDDDRRDLRTVIRGPRIARTTITGVNPTPAGGAPTMDVEVVYRAVLYSENRATQTVVRGSRDATTGRVATWRFVLTDRADLPWRLERVTDRPR